MVERPTEVAVFQVDGKGKLKSVAIYILCGVIMAACPPGECQDSTMHK